MDLHRSRDQKFIGGVAAGLGAYFKLDPLVIRIIFVILFFANGAGILIYALLWFLIPEQKEIKEVNMESSEKSNEPGEAKAPDNQHSSEKRERKRKVNRGSVIGGLVLIVLGCMFLADNLFPEFQFEDYWPLILIFTGIALIWSAFMETSKSSGS